VSAWLHKLEATEPTGYWKLKTGTSLLGNECVAHKLAKGYRDGGDSWRTIRMDEHGVPSPAVLKRRRRMLDSVTESALAHAKFQNRMLKLGPGVVNEAYVRGAVERYFMFLELAREHPDQMLVPSLDIDLIWHVD